MRKSKEELEAIKKKYGVDELWSWSKYNSWKTDSYGWFLKYIKKLKETRSSIYGVSGGNCHDIIERFYNKEISYEDMIKEYEEKLLEMNLAELKYNRKDEKANEKMAKKYEDNIRLFYQQHVPIDTKVVTEKFITVKVGDYVFQGYIDFMHRENGKVIITDWKTSTLYTGKKVIKESGQLVLYAEAIHQRYKVPIEDIVIRWDFLKYCKLKYTLSSKDKETKQFKAKEKNALRTEWVSSIKSNLNTWLKKEELDEFEIEDMIQTAIENNNLDNMPIHIQEKYSISDCYVDIPLNQERIDELKEDILETIKDINNKREEFEETQDDKVFWVTIDAGNEFYFHQLCGYSSKVHKPYKEYLETISLFAKDEKKEEIDDSWLDELDLS